MALTSPTDRQRSDVYAGSTRLGAVEFDGERFVALAADGARLGAYQTSLAAARAVCDADRHLAAALSPAIAPAARGALIPSDR